MKAEGLRFPKIYNSICPPQVVRNPKIWGLGPWTNSAAGKAVVDLERFSKTICVRSKVYDEE